MPLGEGLLEVACVMREESLRPDEGLLPGRTPTAAEMLEAWRFVRRMGQPPLGEHDAGQIARPPRLAGGRPGRDGGGPCLGTGGDTPPSESILERNVGCGPC